MADICFTVHPHLLRDIADAECNSEEERHAARQALHIREAYTTQRAERFSVLCRPENRWHQQSSRPPSIVPGGILRHLSDSADVTVEVAEQLFGKEAANIVRDAWDEVGVTRNEPKDPKEPEPPKSPKEPKEPQEPGDCDTMRRTVAEYATESARWPSIPM